MYVIIRLGFIKVFSSKLMSNFTIIISHHNFMLYDCSFCHRITGLCCCQILYVLTVIMVMSSTGCRVTLLYPLP